MKRLASEKFYANKNETNCLLGFKTMLLIISINFFIIKIGVDENYHRSLGIETASLLMLVNFFLIFLQFIFANISWETRFYKVFAEIVLWISLVELLTMLIFGVFTK